jgi:xanthine dehydrogenase large subunit
VKQVGVPRSHESARGHVTGSAKYVDDLWPGRTGTVHLWPVTVPHAHARVLGLDLERALSAPGVLTVLTAADVPGVNDIGPARRDEPLFPSEVCFHGQAVAWVVAETEAEARSAASLVALQVEPLPAILSIEAALAAQSFHTPVERIARGDVEAALAQSELQLEGVLAINGQEHFYLETQAALAWCDESDGVFVHSSTQHPAETQEVVARVLGLQRHDVVVQCSRMGGAFGGKEVQANAWAALAALAAHKVRRPARVRLTRQQDLRLTGKRHPFLARFKVGFTRGGKLEALDIELFSDGGWSLDLSAPVLFRAMFHVDNCYSVEHLRVTGQVCRTHNLSHTAFRGFGGPQGMLVIEEVIDRVARTLEVPPHLLRENNFYRKGDRSHYGQEIRDAERIDRIWSELKASSQFSARWREIERYNSQHAHHKRGLAITPVKFGISFTTAFFNQAGALVLVYRDGSVQVNHGGTEMGQGLHTKIAQIAADSLGVNFEAIRVMPTRTDKVPNTSATAASAGSDLNGAAVVSACNTLQRRLAAIAAEHFKTAAEGIQFDGGHVYPQGQPARAVPFGDIVERAYLARVPLFSSGYYRTPKLHFDRASGTGKPFHYYAYGAAVCEVRVNGFTGQYEVRRVDILHDVGDSLSPLIDRGQIEGGFIQGLGWLTTEELVWGAAGELLTSGASTYKLPTLGECPPEFRVALLARAAEPGVVFGSKAVGEPPLMLAISAREALRAAVASFGPSGHLVELATPATPEAVFWAIEAARQKRLRLLQASAAQ